MSEINNIQFLPIITLNDLDNPEPQEIPNKSIKTSDTGIISRKMIREPLTLSIPGYIGQQYSSTKPSKLNYSSDTCPLDFKTLTKSKVGKILFSEDKDLMKILKLVTSTKIH